MESTRAAAAPHYDDTVQQQQQQDASETAAAAAVEDIRNSSSNNDPAAAAASDAVLAFSNYSEIQYAMNSFHAIVKPGAFVACCCCIVYNIWKIITMRVFQKAKQIAALLTQQFSYGTVIEH
jgi:hypothetical protein